MISFELNEIDVLDIADIVLPKIEESFGFKFGKRELEQVKTYGELCDIIVNKIELSDSNDCTTQQAFYKLRDAISVALNMDKRIITLNTILTDIISDKHIRASVKRIEKSLGFSLGILRPSYFVSWALIIVFIISLFAFFFNWKYAAGGVGFSLIGLIISSRLAGRIDPIAIAELSEKITREHYIQVRRNPTSANKREILKQIEELFVCDVYAKRESLKREASFM